jgi:Gpi18-like mannosyltransferase
MTEQTISSPPSRPVEGIEDRNASRWLAVAVALLAVYGVWRLPFWLANANPDQTDAFVPWLAHILSMGRFHALSGSFSDYNPPFLYVLVGSSLFAKFFPPVVIVKLANLPFLLLAAAVVFLVCRRLGGSWQRALSGAGLLLVAPEIVENAWSWGQCDAMYSSFLLLFVVAVAFKRPALGMIAFAIALSFKLQAIFLGPAVLLLILAGEIPVWTVLLAPLVYVAMLAPAMLAGRQPMSLLLVYGSQYKYFNSLAFVVANPYRLMTHYVEPRGLTELVKRIGFLVSALCNAGFLVYLWRRRDVLRSLTGIAVVSALSLMLEVFTLPKMHERYYYPANLMLLLLVTINPRRFWLPALLLQTVSVVTYGPYLYGTKANYAPLFVPLVLMVIMVFYLLYREVERMHRDSPTLDRVRTKVAI